MAHMGLQLAVKFNLIGGFFISSFLEPIRLSCVIRIPDFNQSNHESAPGWGWRPYDFMEVCRNPTIWAQDCGFGFWLQGFKVNARVSWGPVRMKSLNQKP